MSEDPIDDFKLFDNAIEYRGRKVATLVDGLPGWLVRALISALEDGSYDEGFDDGYREGRHEAACDDDESLEPKQQPAAQAPAA